MALTSDQIVDLRGDLGDTGATPAFSDAELDRLYVRAAESYEQTVVMAIDQLLMNAAKLNDYTAGQTHEKKSQVFDHLKSMRAIWAERVTSVKTASNGQVQAIGWREQPKPKRDRPYTE